jgi:hypothetical protein
VVLAVAAVSAAFRLKGNLHVCEIRAEPIEHCLNDMVGSNAKNLVPNLGRHMPISQMPGHARKLSSISMPDLDNQLHRGPDLQPPPIFELQPVSVCHRNGFRKIEEDLFASIRHQTDAPVVTLLEVEREGFDRLVLWPKPGGTMNRCAVQSHINT